MLHAILPGLQLSIEMLPSFRALHSLCGRLAVAASVYKGQPCVANVQMTCRALCIPQVIFSALADGGPSPATTADSLQRLLFDVFQRDVREFRRVQCAT